MKKTLLASLAALMLLCASPRAEAKLFEIWGSGLAGGGWGKGDTDKDFYRFASGGATGVEIGAKFLFISAFIDYLRWFGGTASANMLSFNLGGDSSIGLTDSLSVVLRMAGAYYYCTLPDDATLEVEGVPISTVETRGIGVHGGVGLRFTFAKIFSVGVTPEIGYHYFFGGAETPITDSNSSGFDLTVLGYFRVGLGF